MRLVGRALRARWPMPEVVPKNVVIYAASLLASKDAKTRDRLTAAKLLVEIEKLGLEAIKVEIQARTTDQLEEQIKALEMKLAAAEQPPTSQGW